MKVFFVMVLVLVFGAVPNDGRTESEGTVFNKTQPHESMNNVTVSSSKLVTYGYLYLVMQWPRSFCNFLNIADRQCYEPVPDRFTVHGLWPQLSGRGIDCANRRRYGQYPLFKSNQLHQRLVPDLNTYWPDLKSWINNNECFWGTEYNKHGSCTFNDQNAYFDLTLRMVEHLRISRISGGAIIVPGDHWPIDIGRAVHRVTHKWPWLKCIAVGDSIQLLEIGFCFRGNNQEPYDCYGVINCGNGKVYFP